VPYSIQTLGSYSCKKSWGCRLQVIYAVTLAHLMTLLYDIMVFSWETECRGYVGTGMALLYC
jgi:hypothetical protein